MTRDGGRTIPADAACLWVSLPFATFGLVILNGFVVAAPPIARWSCGRNAHDVVAYYRARGARLQQVPR